MTLVVPPIEAPRLLARVASGMVIYAVGGVRVRAHDQDVEAANQAFASPLVGGGPIGARWWFVSAHGTVASAADPLDNVLFERDLGAPVTRAFVRDAMLVAVLADGRVVRADVAPPVASPGTSSPAPPAALSATPPPVVPSTMSPESIEAQVALVSETALRRFPLARLTLPSTRLLASGDVAVQGNGAVYFASATPDGTLQPSARVVLGAQAQGACDLHAWGTRALLTCPAGTRGAAQVPVTPFVVDHDTVARVGPPTAGALVIGREGHTLTFAHACPDPDESSSAPRAAGSDSITEACTLDRDRDWREWQYPRRGRLIDVFDATALVLENREGGAQLRYYDIDMGRGVDVQLDDPTVEIARAGFLSDGRILVLATAGGGRAHRSLVGIGQAGRILDLRPVGFFVRDLDFADANLGLAVGENAGDVAETRDGGITWLRVEGVAIDGDPHAFALFPPTPSDAHVPVQRVGTEVRCSPALCLAGTHLVHTWDRSVEVVPLMP